MAQRAGSTTVQFSAASHVGGLTHYAARFVKLIEQAMTRPQPDPHCWPPRPPDWACPDRGTCLTWRRQHDTGSVQSEPRRRSDEGDDPERRDMDRRHAMTDDAATTYTRTGDGTMRPFQIDVAQEAIDDLRRRITATRWPTRELVADRSQGVQLAAIQSLARYWTTEYDWRRCEARLNALPQFKTEIDGLDIHFIHVKSPHDNALPLIMTHGWPGSIIELLETIGPLTDPTAHGGTAEDAFHLVLPSIPGYGFSDEPTELGWGPIRIGQAWDELMRRLGYTRYVAQGGDVGSQVTDAMGRLALDGLIGIHTNLLTPALGDAKALSASPPTEEERAALDQLDTFHATGTGYFVEQATRPETIGYALLDSPIALGGVDDRSRYGQLREDRPRLCRRTTLGQSHPGTHRRQHHAVLVDKHWGLGCALVLGRRTRKRSCSRPSAHAGLGSGRLHHVPRGDLADPAQLGREGISQRRHLLQRGGQGRSLRRLGGTGALLGRVARRLPAAALADTRELNVTRAEFV